jgi:hypothetical protein
MAVTRFHTHTKSRAKLYLHIIYLLKSSTCFEHYPAHHQEVYVIIVYMQPLVSSLSAGDCPVHRLRKKFFLNRCTGQSLADSDDTRGCVYRMSEKIVPFSKIFLWAPDVILEFCAHGNGEYFNQN